MTYFTKADLVRLIAEREGLRKVQAERIVAAMLDTITQEAEGGARVRLAGFGTFELRTSAARTGRNPQTGLPIDIPARETLVFKASKKAAL